MKKFVVFGFIALSGLSFGMLHFASGEDQTTLEEQPSYIESMKLASSRYTQPADDTTVDSSLFLTIDDDEDRLIAENDKLRLYINDDILSFKIENKDTGYVYATHIDNSNAGSYEGLLSGGIGLEYIAVDKKMNIRSNVGITDTVYTAEINDITNGVSVSMDIDGYCATRNCKRLYPFYLEGRYTLQQMIDMGFAELNIGFDLRVTLEEDGIRAHIPIDSVTEENPDRILLSSIIVFPGLGATRMDEIPGYMMIPDGSGALIRYEDNQGKYLTPYSAPFYGRDYGLEWSSIHVTSYPLSLPIFGMVHGVKQNGLLGVVESGMFSSSLFTYFNGAHNLDYNLMFPKFYYRKTYRQSFTSDGSGGAMRNVRTLYSDIVMTYKVLDGNDADYIGMANTYRSMITGQHSFDNHHDDPDIPLHLTYLMSDSESSFFGTNSIAMSTYDDVRTMHTYFINHDITSSTVSLMGWNDGGYSGYLPADMDFENKLGSNRAYQTMLNLLRQTGNVYLINDLVIAGERSSLFSAGRDVARGINHFQLGFSCRDCVHEDRYVLKPSATKRYTETLFPDVENDDVGMLLENLGNTAFSYHDNGSHTREDSYDVYQDIMANMNFDAAFKYPHAYAYPYVNAFMDTPLYNSQMTYFDDLVPVLQTVLRGLIPMFSDYLNFNSLGREQLLMLIDFGVYPSFILTKKQSSELKDTDVERFYTTEFDLWKDTVVNEYMFINDALKTVIGEQLLSRTIMSPGFVKNTYANGIDIYINYTSQTQADGSITVTPLSYRVEGDPS